MRSVPTMEKAERTKNQRLGYVCYSDTMGECPYAKMLVKVLLLQRQAKRVVNRIRL